MYESLKEIVEMAIQNKATRDAILIIVGRISYAVERRELTLREARKLEDMLGGRSQWLVVDRNGKMR
jgi:hypothetical protein